MNSTSQRPNPPGRISLRNSIICLFVSVLLIYAIISSSISFNKSQDCTYNQSLQISRKENLETGNTITLPDYNNSSRKQISIKKDEFPDDEKEEESVPPPPTIQQRETKLNHIVFGIAASSNLWDNRKEYIKLWWRPGKTRGTVWLDEEVTVLKNESLPEIRISGDTSGLPYRHYQGNRSALRISRVVSETLRLGMNDVRWFVMGDDDTVFIVDNLVTVLSKYDHNQFYYIGSTSESHIQNIQFSYSMAYGGGGFAISYPLAKELEKMQDQCIRRYPDLYGSDDRIHACMAEIGVPLTIETGFHQFDVYGNLLGLLAAHPVTPLVSLHHLDIVNSIFPGMNRVQSLKLLLESTRYDSASLVQQSICYDRQRHWSISVSWGYVVQVIRGVISPRELQTPSRTFLNWYKRADYTAYAFNTRPFARHPCQKPFLFFLSKSRYHRENNQVMGIYTPRGDPPPYCRWRVQSPETLDSVVVVKTPDSNRWKKSRRRDCCRVMQSRRKGSLHIHVKNCDEGEISEY